MNGPPQAPPEQPPPGYPPQQPYAAPQPYDAPPGAGGPGVRPARFTVIAILNFVFGGIALLALLGALALVSAVDRADDTGPPATVLYVNLLVGLLNTVLLVVGGIGLLLVKKWGWALCMAYGILAIAWTVIWALAAETGLFTVVGLIYPIVVVSLLAGRVSREAIT